MVDGGYLHGVLAPGHRSLFEAPRAAHHLLLAHGAAVARLPRARRRGKHRHRRQPRAQVSGQRPPGGRRRDARAPTRYMNRQYLDPLFLGRYPEELADDLRRGLARVRRPRTSRAIRAADRLPGHQLLHARRHGATTPERWPTGARATVQQPASDLHRDSTGRSIPTALDARRCAGCSERYGDDAALRHRERRRLLRPAARRRTAASTIRCASPTCATTSRRCATRSPRASTCAATSPGRCSTTSSGATATPSASASCTSTTRRSERTPKASARFYAEVARTNGRRRRSTAPSLTASDLDAVRRAPLSTAGRGSAPSSVAPVDRRRRRVPRPLPRVAPDLDLEPRAAPGAGHARAGSSPAAGRDRSAALPRSGRTPSTHSRDRRAAARRRSRCTRSSRRGRGRGSRGRRRCRAGRRARPSSARGPCCAGSMAASRRPTSSASLHLGRGGDRPGRGVGVDAAVLAQAGRVAGDVADRLVGHARRRGRGGGRRPADQVLVDGGEAGRGALRRARCR